MLEIEVLGSQAEVEESAPNYSRHSGVLIDGKILFDLGEREYLKLDPDYILITHLHPDHAFFVTDRVEGIDCPVYGPEKSEEVKIKILDEAIDLDGYKITPVPTHHSKLVDSQAYLLEEGDKRILYTGDVIWINKEHHDKLKGLDLVITDGSYIRKGGLVRRDKETGRLYGHNGIPDLVDLFRRFTGYIIFTHFGGWFYKDIEESRKTIEELSGEGLKVEAAHDGMKVEI
ncbi:MAG: MBL fold metallo-hydrolase [Candidatus Bathyarchaeia archaeon]